MAEAARRCPSEAQALGTPRKRSRGSPGPQGSPSAFKTPVKKRIKAFPEGPSQKSGNGGSASQLRLSPSPGEEGKENQGVPVKPVTSRRLDIPPLQEFRESRVPTAPRGGSPGKSPLKSRSSRPPVPVGSFYGRGKSYLDPVERKRLQEIRVLGMRSRDGNVPAAGRGENPGGNGGGNPHPRAAKRAPNPGNGGGNPNPRAAKRAPKPKGGRSAPKSRKGQAEIPAGKPRGEKEGGNCLIQKKMDSPFRVLSMKVKPALRLQLGAAFFAAGKKSHSRKNPGDSKAPQALPKAPQEKAEPAEGSEAPEERGQLGSIPTAQEEGKESRESSGNVGDAGPAGKASPGKTGSVSCASQAGAAENGGAGGISSSPGWESRDCVVLSNQSPPGGNKQASPSQAVVYPIFSAPLASRKRLLDEIPSPFGSSPPGKAPHSSQKSRKAKELCRRSRDQMIIDAGQKHFGAIMCKSCGMIYSAASPEDEAQHLQHHQRFLEALRYGWKKERVVAEFWDGKIVLILPTDPKYAVKKAEEVREIVDGELGFQQASVRGPEQSRTYLTYLFVSGGTIVGCLLAEPITQAFRVLCDAGRSRCSRAPSPPPGRAWRCSARAERALCGVSRIWVLGARRRGGIATRMLDVLRSTFTFGSVLSSREIAFSDPTPHGKLLASSYCRTPNFLVYNFLSQEAPLGKLGSSWIPKSLDP
ncbi:N-acetyltransferase ESCO2 isoform X2 [Myiozetetes cayanensis]|uniref:N-acetyltransferase ESCO2 isoform X2 n=1 Tax=Myiozetetes cayanensis TaxID=478635 RepID=UPI00215E89AD|nr:N-acetyltransferase ESCO2 isoform X2 [Myiozetetes cayanensis]